MSSENENIARNGWSEYGRLVLNELQRLNQGQDDLKKDLDSKFNDLNSKLSDLSNIEKDIDDLKIWKEKVVDVWSTSQMKQSKDELYAQKNRWQIAIGVLLAIQVLWALFIAFKDKIF